MRSLCILSLLLLAAPVAAQDVRTGRLDNGMTYYIHENRHPAGLAEFYIVHNIGAVQEQVSQQGMAHFIEHLAFKGTRNFPEGRLLSWLEAQGMRWGPNVNAETSAERTIYKISQVPTAREGVVDSVLLVLHDWSRFVTLNDKAVDAERGVIIEELRQRSGLGLRMHEKTAPALYGSENRHAHRNVIGTEQRLRTVTAAELRLFYDKWYRPDLQAVIVVGDIDAGQIEAKLRRTMSDIAPASNPTPKHSYPIAEHAEPRFAIVVDPEQRSARVMLHITRPATAQVHEPIMLGAAVRIMNQRLATLAPSSSLAAAGMSDNRLTSHDRALTIGADVHAVLSGFEVILRELERLRRFGITEKEFDRQKAQMLAAVENELARASETPSGNLVGDYVENFTHNTPLTTPEQFRELISAMTVEELNSLIARVITTRNNVVTIAAPEHLALPTEEELTSTMRRVRASELAPPVFADAPALPTLDILPGGIVKNEKGHFGSTVLTFVNGARAVLLPTDFGSGQILISARADGGTSALESEERPAATALSALIANIGAGGMSRQELAQALSGKNLNMQLHVSRFSTGVGGAAAVRDIESLLHLLWLYFNEPNFSQIAFETLYDHFFKDQAGAYTFYFVGDIDFETLLPLLEKYIGSLPAAKHKLHWRDDGLANTLPPSAPGSVELAWSGEIAYTQQNSLAMAILGNCLNIRCRETIRQKRGGAYAINLTQGIARLPRGSYMLRVDLQTAPSAAAEMAAAVEAELRSIAENGPLASDFAQTVEFWRKNRPETIRQNSTWLTLLTDFYTWGEDWNATWERDMTSLTPKTVQALAQKILADARVMPTRSVVTRR